MYFRRLNFDSETSFWKDYRLLGLHFGDVWVRNDDSLIGRVRWADHEIRFLRVRLGL